jgi:hypothetical protein
MPARLSEDAIKPVGILSRSQRGIAGRISPSPPGRGGRRQHSVLAPVHGSTSSVAANRLNHIFGKAEHALDDLVTKFGSQEKAYEAVQRAADAALAEGKLIPGRNGVLPSGDAGIIIDVAGTPVRLIGGRVKDGAVQLSSFSRKGL